MEHLQRLGMRPGNAYPSGHLNPSRFLGLAYAPIIKTFFPNLLGLFLTFHLDNARFFLDVAPVYIHILESEVVRFHGLTPIES